MFALLRTAALALLTGLAISSWYSASIAIDSQADKGYRQELRSLEVSGAKLSSDLLESRAGLVTHYDALVRRIAALGKESSRLATPPAFISPSAARQIEEGVSDYQAVLASHEELIESFKFDHAVLRNSLRFFPGEARTLELRILSQPGGQELAALLGKFHSDVVQYYLFGESKLVDSVRDQGATLEEKAVTLADHDAQSLRLLVRHADVIMERKPRVDQVIATVLDFPFHARVQHLYEVYEADYRSAATAASRAKLATWLMALALVLVAASYIILRLRHSARALSGATGELKAALAALGIEKEKHKELAELKSRFVSMTSHEFRTPLSVVLSSTELLDSYGERWTEDKRKRHLLRIQDAAIHMKQMLEDVLLIGRAEADRLESEPRRINLNDFCIGLLEASRLHSGSKQDVAFHCSADVEAVMIDPQLLMHILDNLLSNAIKYSSNEVSLDICRDGADLVLTIRDQGIGISEEDQLRLFETFHRGANVGEVSGTGLGLAVVKKSLDILKGSITVESELGTGSTFVVRIPGRVVVGEELRDSA